MLRWRCFLTLFSRIDAELLHRLTIFLIRRLSFSPPLLRIISGDLKDIQIKPCTFDDLGFKALHRVGLAAGFDKNSEILAQLPSLGFGFAEIGTVTLKAQEGNIRPRLFRSYADDKIFNSMGFNNLGAVRVAKNVEAAKAKLPPDFGIGINIGKNKETPLEAAAQEYADVAAHFVDLAGYFVINVSSPNTPGLRALQKIESLLPILMAVKNCGHNIPVFLKLSPEVENQELLHLIEMLDRHGCNGFVLGNTLAGEHLGISGGWSGSPLAELAKKSLTSARTATKKPIISVGGILDSCEAQTRINLGAQAIQIYSAWVLRGPQFPSQLRRALK